MKSRRLKQIFLSLCVVLSLFASSVAACACSHHLLEAEVHAVSCHQMSEAEDSQAEQSKDVSQFETVAERCNCFAKTSQPSVVNKAKNLKLQNHSLILPSLPKVERYEAIVEIVSVKASLTTRFYNSNYLDKLKPARAPPVL